MPQAVWTGQLSFGLVNIPVKLYNATAPQRVRFHHYEAETGRRVQYRRVAAGPAFEVGAGPPGERRSEPIRPPAVEESRSLPSDPGDRPPIEEPPWEAPGDPGGESEVAWDEVVRGFEVEPGRVVTVTPEELSSVAPQPSRVVEVEQFVHLRDIDPVYFDKSYYVAPRVGMGAERPYWLLYRAMEAAAEVAVGRFVMRTKEYLAVVRASEHLLMLETLFYADEVRDPKEVWAPPAEEPPERELSVAQQLVEALVGDWDPSRHRDEHRERLLDLLRSKSGEAHVLPEPEAEIMAPAFDLLEALEASVEAAKQARSAKERDAG